MAMVKQIFLAGLVMGVVTLSACVTINIYFPAAAAEKAADKIIDEVWQLKQQEDADKAPAGDKPAETTPAPAN
jgi:hypothetical protein